MAPKVAIATMISTVGESPSVLSAADPKTVEKSRYAATGQPGDEQQVAAVAEGAPKFESEVLEHAGGLQSGGDAVGDGDEGVFEGDAGDLDVMGIRLGRDERAQRAVGVAAAQLDAAAVRGCRHRAGQASSSPAIPACSMENRMTRRPTESLMAEGVPSATTRPRAIITMRSAATSASSR